MKQNEWEKQMREQMEGFGQPVPDDLWADIEASLPAPSASRSVALRRWWPAAAVLLLLVVGGSYIYNKVENGAQNASEPLSANDVAMRETAPQQPTAAPASHVATSVDPLTAMSDHSATAHLAASASVVRPGFHAQRVSEGRGAQPDAHQFEPSAQQFQPSAEESQTDGQVLLADGMAVASDMLPDTVDLASRVVSDTAAVQPSARSEAAEKGVLLAHTPAPTPRRHVAERRRQQAPVSAMLYASNIGGGASASNSTVVEPMLMSRSYMNRYNAVYDGRPMLLNNYENETEHELPYTIGASLRVALLPHLWTETGLLYTSARSTFTHRLGRHVSVDEQRLHYVGVPLTVGCTFWQTGPLSLYASTGAEADVCVAAHTQTDGVEGTLERDRWQFSLSAHVGAEYRLVEHWGLYVQPGVKYYPDNGSRLQTLFKEKPLNIDLQFGLRYTLR